MSVVRGNLQLDLLTGTRESVHPMKMSVLQVSVLYTWRVFEFAQYPFSWGLKFTHFKFALLTMDWDNKFDQNLWVKAIFLRITNKYRYQISTFLQTSKKHYHINRESWIISKLDNNRQSRHGYSSWILAKASLHCRVLQFREFTTPCSIWKKLSITDLSHLFRTICLLFCMRS